MGLSRIRIHRAGDPAVVDGIADAPPVHEVLRFREKPTAELAETFLKQGNFRWNAGMFIWTIPAILHEFDRHSPDLADFVGQICQTKDIHRILAERFASLPKISVDYAIMERAQRVLVVEAAFDWDDLGSWIAVAKYLEEDGAGNSCNNRITQIDSSNNIVYSNQGAHIALFGAQNLIVVQTEDALLICDRSQAERIKEIVGKVPDSLR